MITTFLYLFFQLTRSVVFEADIGLVCPRALRSHQLTVRHRTETRDRPFFRLIVPPQRPPLGLPHRKPCQPLDIFAPHPPRTRGIYVLSLRRQLPTMKGKARGEQMRNLCSVSRRIRASGLNWLDRGRNGEPRRSRCQRGNCRV